MSDDITFCADAENCKEDCERHPKNIKLRWREHSYMHLCGTKYCKIGTLEEDRKIAEWLYTTIPIEYKECEEKGEK